MSVYTPERRITDPAGKLGTKQFIRLTSAAVGHIQRLDFTDVLYVLGGVSIVAGCGLVAAWLALIVAGALLLAAALVLTFGPSSGDA